MLPKPRMGYILILRQEMVHTQPPGPLVPVIVLISIHGGVINVADKLHEGIVVAFFLVIGIAQASRENGLGRPVPG